MEDMEKELGTLASLPSRQYFDPKKVALLKSALHGKDIKQVPPKPMNVSCPQVPMELTSSGRNKGLGKANEPKFDCQVCGDLAAGFHCGAYICEACKKFYLRCLKNGSSGYQCAKKQSCVISRETRSHCQFCRYQKCINLGMYKPGREDSKQMRVDFKSISCKVCGSPSSGFHFGAITCEGCKGFFRRMVKENLHKKFVCSGNGSCDLSTGNRTACKHCRYQKCLSIGMTLQGTRLGRQSNSIKRNTLLQFQRHGQDVALIKDEEARSKLQGNFFDAPVKDVTVPPTHPPVIKTEKDDTDVYLAAAAAAAAAAVGAGAWDGEVKYDHDGEDSVKRLLQDAQEISSEEVPIHHDPQEQQLASGHYNHNHHQHQQQQEEQGESKQEKTDLNPGHQESMTQEGGVHPVHPAFRITPQADHDRRLERNHPTESLAKLHPNELMYRQAWSDTRSMQEWRNYSDYAAFQRNKDLGMLHVDVGGAGKKRSTEDLRHVSPNPPQRSPAHYASSLSPQKRRLVDEAPMSLSPAHKRHPQPQVPALSPNPVHRRELYPPPPPPRLSPLPLSPHHYHPENPVHAHLSSGHHLHPPPPHHPLPFSGVGASASPMNGGLHFNQNIATVNHIHQHLHQHEHYHHPLHPPPPPQPLHSPQLPRDTVSHHNRSASTASAVVSVSVEHRHQHHQQQQNIAPAHSHHTSGSYHHPPPSPAITLSSKQRNTPTAMVNNTQSSALSPKPTMNASTHQHPHHPHHRHQEPRSHHHLSSPILSLSSSPHGAISTEPKRAHIPPRVTLSQPGTLSPYSSHPNSTHDPHSTPTDPTPPPSKQRCISHSPENPQCTAPRPRKPNTKILANVLESYNSPPSSPVKDTSRSDPSPNVAINLTVDHANRDSAYNQTSVEILPPSEPKELESGREYRSNSDKYQGERFSRMNSSPAMSVDGRSGTRSPQPDRNLKHMLIKAKQEKLLNELFGSKVDYTVPIMQTFDPRRNELHQPSPSTSSLSSLASPLPQYEEEQREQREQRDRYEREHRDYQQQRKQWEQQERSPVQRQQEARRDNEEDMSDYFDDGRQPPYQTQSPRQQQQRDQEREREREQDQEREREEERERQQEEERELDRQREEERERQRDQERERQRDQERERQREEEEQREREENPREKWESSEDYPSHDNALSPAKGEWNFVAECQRSFPKHQMITSRLLEAYQELHNIMTRPKQLDELDLTKDDPASAWKVVYMSFAHHTKYIIRFIKKIPGFTHLNVADQISLVRDAIYPVTLLYHAFYYVPDAEPRWFVHTARERDYILHFFPMFRRLSEHITYTGFIFKSLSLSPMELAYMCAICVFSIEMNALEKRDDAVAIQEWLTDAFLQASHDDPDTSSSRPAVLLLRLSELKRANVQHSHIAHEAQKTYPDLDFGQLWYESFLEYGI